jgi:hypothetical protein
MYDPFALDPRYFDFKDAIEEAGCAVSAIRTFR